jgi:hypothetical protein
MSLCKRNEIPHFKEVFLCPNIPPLLCLLTAVAAQDRGLAVIAR